MSADIPESVKEEIRKLRKQGLRVREIYDITKGKCPSMNIKQCGSIAAWIKESLAQKRKSKNARVVQSNGSSPAATYKNVSNIAEKRTKAMNENREITSKASPLEAVAQEKPTWAGNEGPIITKAEAIHMLSQGYDPGKMAGYYKGFTEGELVAFSAHINMGTYKNNPALLEGNGKKRGNGESKPIHKKEDFIPFVAKNGLARDMSLLALTLSADGGQIEEAIMELYHGKFKSKDELHELLKETKEDIAKIIEEGVTNLGAFMGDYTLFDRRMAPIILGGVANAIPLDKATPSLEKMLLRVAHGLWDPAFNRDTRGTIADLTKKAEKSVNLAQGMYASLVRHYQATLTIEENLKKYEAAWNAQNTKVETDGSASMAMSRKSA